MKLIVVACLVAMAMAAPRLEDDFFPFFFSNVFIEKDERVDHGDGNFNYNFELSDGTAIEAEGSPNDEGAVTIQGAYRYTLPNGVDVHITYVADEAGFRPQGDVIPIPHPLPAHAIEQIRFAEEQRAAAVAVA